MRPLRIPAACALALLTVHCGAGSRSRRPAERDADAGDAAASTGGTAGSGGAGPTGGTAGAGGTTGAGGTAGSTGGTTAADAGTSTGGAGTASGGATATDGGPGAGGGASDAGPLEGGVTPGLTRCDTAIRVDGATGSTLPDYPTWHAGPGAPSLITWRSSETSPPTLRARSYDGTDLGADTAVLASRTVDLLPELRAVTGYGYALAVGEDASRVTAGRVYDAASDTWGSELALGGITSALAVRPTSGFLRLYTTTALGKELQSIPFVGGSVTSTTLEVPEQRWGDTLMAVDSLDRGALVGLDTTGQVRGYVLRDGAVVGRATQPAVTPSDLAVVLEPNGDALAIWLPQNGLLTASTLSWDGSTASWSTAVPVGPTGLGRVRAVATPGGEVTVAYHQGLSTWAIKRIAGVWGAPVAVAPAGQTYPHLGLSPSGRVSVASESAGAGIVVAAAEPGSASWSSVVVDGGSSAPAVTGFADDGDLVVTWRRFNTSTARDELVFTTCR